MRRVAALALALVAVAVPSAALATGPPTVNLTLEVNTPADAPDALLGDQRCDTDLESPDDQCTLRAAVQEANVFAGTQTILVPAETYVLTIGGSGEDAS